MPKSSVHHKNNYQTDIIGGNECIYQVIHFKPDIMKEYYVGDVFVGIHDRDNFDEEELSGMIQNAGMDGFMPELVSELKEVIGMKAFDKSMYDGYEFGGGVNGGGIDEVNFYFWIKKEDYEKVMSNLKYWSIAKELDHLIKFDVKNIQFA